MIQVAVVELLVLPCPFAVVLELVQAVLLLLAIQLAPLLCLMLSLELMLRC